MAEERTENTSAATILVAVVLVLIIGLAFYFGLIRGGNDGVGGPEEGNDIQLNETTVPPAQPAPGGVGTTSPASDAGGANNMWQAPQAS